MYSNVDLKICNKHDFLEEKIDTIVVIIILPDFTGNYYLGISYTYTVFRSLAVFLKGVIEESTSGKGWCH